MLRTELLRGATLIRTYSDAPGMGLLQTDTGIRYWDAVDLNPCPHTYEEIKMDQHDCSYSSKDKNEI